MTERTHTFATGTEVTLLPLNAMVLQSFQLEGRPKRPPIPMDVSTVNGETMLTPNPQHPDYLEAIEDFERREEEYRLEQLLVSMRYAFVLGVKDEPPAEWVELHKRFVIDKHQMKYSWVFSQLADMEEAVEFLNLIVGQTEPTEQGISESEDRFPALGSGQGGSDASERVSDEQDESGGSGNGAADGGA